jgi:hypothetical protein
LHCRPLLFLGHKTQQLKKSELAKCDSLIYLVKVAWITCFHHGFARLKSWKGLIKEDTVMNNPSHAEQPISLTVVENLDKKEPVSLAEALKILDAANAEHEKNAAALLADLNILMAESEAAVAEYNIPERQLKRA